MTRLVVDASVAMKWYAPEDGTVAAINILEKSKYGLALHAPEILYAEFGNILWKKHRKGELDDDNLWGILDLFLSAPISIDGSRDLLPRALEISTRSGRTLYDSLYLALAAELECGVVTADMRLVNGLADTPWAGLIVSLNDYS